MMIAVGPQADYTTLRMPRAPLVPNQTMDAANAGTAASHSAPVQSIFTSWRTLNTTKTVSGTSTDERMNNHRRAASAVSSPASGLLLKRETSRVRTPIGVSSTTTEIISL